MSDVDFGGSPATPYFGKDGRAEATAKAKSNTDVAIERRVSGVDTGPAGRDVDAAGREVVAPQVHDVSQEGVPATPSAEGNAEAAAEAAEDRANKSQEENATKDTGGGNDGTTVGAVEPEPTGSVTANAVETGQSTRNEFEQNPSDEATAPGVDPKADTDGVVTSEDGTTFTDSDGVERSVETGEAV